MHSSKAGLIINERLLNMPPKIGPPLNQSLFEEISWAQEDEPTEVHQLLLSVMCQSNNRLMHALRN